MRNIRHYVLAPYHLAWALGAALYYHYPARHLTVIGVTGTKGKSSVAEMLHAICTAAGHKTALTGTIHFAIGTETEPNLYKMTLPGRGFVQQFLARARTKQCTHAIVEITSEAARQYRHFGLALDALIFTNLQKEHVESHGSMENYFRAKFAIGQALARSPKRPRSIVANSDDARGKDFLALPVENKYGFSLADATAVAQNAEGVRFEYKNVAFSIPHPGTHTILNALAAIKAAEALGIPLATSAQALHDLARIGGRVEKIEAGQEFIAIVDYAHTPDSLNALYASFPTERKICVLGNTGGGRDTWKRPEMGKIADETCDEVILTNEDPYDEDPRAIVDAMAAGMKRAPTIIMDRREAIRYALSRATKGDAVLISGKGTDPYLMEAQGVKTPWSDAQVVHEELTALLSAKH